MPEDKAKESPEGTGQAEKAPEDTGQETAEEYTGEPSTEPDLAGFKSVEDLAQSYQELRREYTQGAQRLAQIEQFLDAQEAQATGTEEKNPLNRDAFWKMMNDHPDPEGYFAQLVDDRVQARVFGVMADMAEQRAFSTLPDFAKYADQVRQVLREEKLGMRFSDNPYAAVEFAYAKVIARDRQGASKTAFEAGGRAAMENLKTGQRATAPVGKPTPKTPATPDFQNMPIDQLEAWLAKQGRLKTSQ